MRRWWFQVTIITWEAKLVPAVFILRHSQIPGYSSRNNVYAMYLWHVGLSLRSAWEEFVGQMWQGESWSSHCHRWGTFPAFISGRKCQRRVSLPLGLALTHPAPHLQANSTFKKSPERSERFQRTLIIMINMQSRTQNHKFRKLFGFSRICGRDDWSASVCLSQASV